MARAEKFQNVFDADIQIDIEFIGCLEHHQSGEQIRVVHDCREDVIVVADFFTQVFE